MISQTNISEVIDKNDEKSEITITDIGNLEKLDISRKVFFDLLPFSYLQK